MLDAELSHRKVLRIPGRESSAQGERCSGDETIGLGERTAAACELASPLARLPSLCGTERRDPQTLEERFGRSVLAWSEAANRLLDVHSADVWSVVGLTKSEEPCRGFGPPTQQIDERRGVGEDCCQLADPADVRQALVTNPAPRIRVPIVAAVSDRSNRGFDELPPAIVLKCPFDCARDVRAAAADVDPSVELSHEAVVECYLHSHGHNVVDNAYGSKITFT